MKMHSDANLQDIIGMIMTIPQAFLLITKLSSFQISFCDKYHFYLFIISLNVMK